MQAIAKKKEIERLLAMKHRGSDVDFDNFDNTMSSNENSERLARLNQQFG